MKTERLTALTSIMEKLREKRVDTEFRWLKGAFTGDRGKTYRPDDLKIIRKYRFDGNSHSDDCSILYVIEACGDLMGYCLDAYSALTNLSKDFNDFIRRVAVAGQAGQLKFDQ